MNFEEKNKRLEEIVKKLESNKTSIEEATSLYEEGVNIAKDCYEILSQSKGKVTILQKELEDLTEKQD